MAEYKADIGLRPQERKRQIFRFFPENLLDLFHRTRYNTRCLLGGQIIRRK